MARAEIKIDYDPELDAGYLALSPEQESIKQIPLNEDIIVDYGVNGEIVGIEILNLSQKTPVLIHPDEPEITPN